MPVRHRIRVEGVSKYGTFDRLFKGIYDLIRVKIIISKYRKKYDEHVDDMESKQQEFDNDTHLYLVNNFNITDSRTAFSFSENIKSNNKLLYTSHAKWLKWIKQEFTKATSR